MRPVRLAMQAFGPYKGREVVDFTELGDNRLFVIHGETGAGKTSILDAMVFALYGDTSGGERKPGQMRCESADPATPTEVTFDFALGASVYRVTRRPAQELARSRGDGLTSQAARAAIWDVTQAEPGGEGRVLATQIGRVNEQVRQLLGFSSEQFRQVVVLPQGKFRDLLAAGSDKREDILRQLFPTQECRRLEARLKDRAREVIRLGEQLEARRRGVLSTAHAEDETQLAALSAEAAEAAQRARDEAQRAQLAAREAADALAEARRADEAARAVAAARERMHALEADQARVAALEQRAALGRRAQRVAPVAAQHAQAVSRRERAALVYEQAQQALVDAAEQEARAADLLREQQERAAEREAAAKEVNRLLQMGEKVAAWRAADAARGEAEAALETAGAELRAAEQAAAAAAAAKAAAGDRVAGASEARARLDSARQRLGAARRVADLCGKRDAALAEELTLVASREQAAVALKQAQEELGARRREHDATERSWRAGRAAALAVGLVDGAPCPVCGSTEHPAPAQAAGSADDDELAAARERLEAARRHVEECREALAAADARLAAARAGLEVLREQAPAELALAAARDAQAACEAECAELAAVAAAADPDEVAAAAEALEAAERRVAAARQAERAAHGELAQMAALAGQSAAAVPEELREPRALERARAEAEETAARLARELEAAQVRHTDAEKTRVAAERDLVAAREAAEREVAAETEAARLCAAALDEHGFTDEQAYAAAAVPDEELARAEAEVRRHQDAVLEARSELQRAEAAVKQHPAADELAAAEERHERAAAAAAEAQARQGRADAALTSLREVRAALDELSREHAEADELYRVVGRLSDVANGEAGGAKVSFQRWVLGKYLDVVLVAASERLRAMSRGRYELHRQLETADLRRASGLELAVADAWSSRSRPAVTLSGGESFLAALSLALGLAETVETRSGGVRLETIFVDEGFGALDQSALDLAMEALVQLQGSGRLVGVISHVPELRQVIKARLEVAGGPDGSTTVFHVP